MRIYVLKSPDHSCNVTTLMGVLTARHFVVFCFWISLLFHEVAISSSQEAGESAPMFGNQGPDKIMHQKTNNQNFQCNAVGTPTPVYRWMKNGLFTGGNVTDKKLSLRGLDVHHSGVYQCIAANDHGAVLGQRETLSVTYILPFTNQPGTSERFVRFGEHLVIFLPTIESVPDPDVTWYEGTHNTVNREMRRIHVTFQNHLVLLDAMLMDNNDEYHAVASNGESSQPDSTSSSFKIIIENRDDRQVDRGPEIVIPPYNTSAVLGEDMSVALECVANASPINHLTMTWYRIDSEGERQSIDFSQYKYGESLFKRIITIRQISPDDTGWYECEASFTRTTEPFFNAVTRRAYLSVQVKTTFTTPPPPTMGVNYGDDGVVTCETYGIPPPQITWYRNAVLLEDIAQERYTVNEDGSQLTISSVHPSDSGIFQCFATNPAKEQNRATWLRVLSSAAQIDLAPVNKASISGNSVTFNCQASGAPRPDISWYQDIGNGLNEISGEGRMEVTGSGTLRILSTSVLDSGTYMCNASNIIGSSTSNATLSVIVRTRISGSPQNARVIKGSTTTIECKVTHDPSVTVQWLWSHGGSLTNDRWRIDNNGTLTITSVRNNDIGDYTCNVLSSGGNDSATATIQVIELPHPPILHQVLLSNTTLRDVIVSWRTSFDGNTEITGYVVEYRVITDSDMLPDDDWVAVEDNIGSTVLLYTVRDLQPATVYEFRVKARNEVGVGLPSVASQQIRLPQQPPSGPPMDVVVSPRTHSSITVRWSAPPQEQWNGPLLGFKVRHKLQGYPDETVTVDDIPSPAITEHIIDELITFQSYEISVAAYNEKGTGVYSFSKRMRTNEGTPTQPPRELDVVAASSTSLSITWYQPNPQHINGVNQGYKLNITEVDSNIQLPIIELTSNPNTYADQQLYIAQGLNKYTMYEVRILCKSGAGDGPYTQGIRERTHEDYPDAVGSLTVPDVRDTSLYVVWTPPPNANGILLGYTLTYERKNNTLSRESKDLPAVALNTSITELLPETNYTITIWARTSMGAGPTRTTDIESGKPPVAPTSPHNLAITNIQARSVLLQFIPGNPGHTSITMWLVEGQVNGDLNWVVIDRVSAPDASSVTVDGLQPHSHYTLRLIAVNIVGHSPPSEPTTSFQTIQATPETPPPEVTVRAVNETSLRVRWKPLSSDLWNGDGRGYLVQIREHHTSQFLPQVIIDDENANSYIFSSLEEWTPYDVHVASFNDVGNSSYSPTAVDWTRESVPSVGPVSVLAEPLTSTMIQVNWGNVISQHQNGRIIGYKVLYSSAHHADPLTKVLNASQHSTQLTGLRKFTQYRIQVLAFTRMGDGVPSVPVLFVKTLEDVPGPPSRMTFPSVTPSSVRVVWAPPFDLNGEITAYWVSYRRADLSLDLVESDRVEVAHWVHEYHRTGLDRNTRYVFEIYATTQVGAGEVRSAEVVTVINRAVCLPPRRIWNTGNDARSIELSWESPIDCNDAPVRNYSLQMRVTTDSFTPDDAFVTMDDVHLIGDVNNYTLTGLQPASKYEFQIAAVNDIGISEYSAATSTIHTHEAAPDLPPVNVEVTPKTPTSIMVRWEPPSRASQNGELLGYKVWYGKLSYNNSEVTDPEFGDIGWTMHEMELITLIRGQLYEVKVNAFNARGHGPYSTPVDVYVGEAVPTQAPKNFQEVDRTSSEIYLNWEPPAETSWNGELLGYKIFYWREGDRSNIHVRTIAASETRSTLSNLTMYTEYSLVIGAFNAAGDGPNTTVPLKIQTLEGVPSPPGDLSFVVYDLTAVNVSWSEPLKANGEITNYRITYHQDIFIDGQSTSVEVLRSGAYLFHEAKGLSPGMTYVFSVKAKTRINWGDANNATITVAPQEGSTGAPSQPKFDTTSEAVTITWSNGEPGDGDVTGHIIQNRERGVEEWGTLERVETPDTSITISFYNLKANQQYQFRVIALNQHGISPPSRASKYLSTLEITKQKKFYQEWWFLVIVALTALIFIIIVISVLCFTGRRVAVKYRKDDHSLHYYDPTPTIRLEPSRPGPRVNPPVDDDIGFSTYDTRRSARRSQKRTPANNHLPPYTRSPPRPSPAGVRYSDDEESKYPDDNSSTLSDKPDNDSYDEDQESQLTGSDDDSISKHPPSAHPPSSHGLPAYSSYGEPSSSGYTNNYEPDSEVGGASGFTNQHYVNDPVRQSWRKQNKHRDQYANHGDNGAVGGLGGMGGGVYNGVQDDGDYGGMDNGYPQTSNGYNHGHNHPPQGKYNSESHIPNGHYSGGGGDNDNHVPNGQYNGGEGVYNPPSDTSSQQYALNSGHILMNNMAGSRAPLPGFSSFV